MCDVLEIASTAVLPAAGHECTSTRECTVCSTSAPVSVIADTTTCLRQPATSTQKLGHYVHFAVHRTGTLRLCWPVPRPLPAMRNVDHDTPMASSIKPTPTSNTVCEQRPWAPNAPSVLQSDHNVRARAGFGTSVGHLSSPPTVPAPYSLYSARARVEENSAQKLVDNLVDNGDHSYGVSSAPQCPSLMARCV